jgi:multimeric flavodoxin WrbA
VAPPLLHLFSRLRTTAFFTQALRNKITGLITVGFLGHGLDYTLQTMDEFTYGHGMIRAARATVISSSIIFGGRPDYLEHGVLDDKRGMRYVKIVGQRVVELSKMIKYATEAGVAPPTKFNIATGGSM